MEILVLCCGIAVVALGALLARRLHRAREAQALVLWRGDEPRRVYLGGTWVWVVPGLYRMLPWDLAVRRIVVERRGRQGMTCRDGIRVDLRATFLVGVAHREADVLRVVRELGWERAREPERVRELLEEHFARALAHSVSTFSFEELVADRGLFIDHVGVEVGNELWGFRLERMSLGRLEQTPLDQLDPTNELDAQGIQRLSERALPVVGAPVEPRALPEVGPREEDEADLAREVEQALTDVTRRH